MYANNEFALMKDKVTCRMGVNMSNEKTQKHEQVNEPVSDGAFEDKRSEYSESNESSESAREAVSQQKQAAAEHNNSEAEHTEIENHDAARDGTESEQQVQEQDNALPQLHVEAPSIALLDTTLLQGVTFHSQQSSDSEQDDEQSKGTEQEAPVSDAPGSASPSDSQTDLDVVDQHQAVQEAQSESQDAQDGQIESSSASVQDGNNPAVSSTAGRIFGNLHANDALSKRKAVLRRIVAPIFAVIAVLSIITAVLCLTVWRVNPQVDIATTSMNTAYAVTDAGLLDTTDGPVTITARTDSKASKTSSSSSPQICIALTSSSDALGWLEGTAYTRISGFNSWQEFATTAHKAQGKTAQGNATFTNSDMWQQVRCGAGSVNLTWQKQHDQDAVVVVHVLDEQESAQLAKEQQQGNADATDQPTAQSDQSADQTANTEKSKSDTSVNRNADAQMTVRMQWTRSSTPNHATPLWIIAATALLLAILCATLFVVWPKPHVPRVGRHGHGARTRHSTMHRHGAKATDSASTARATNAVVVGANDTSNGSEGQVHADATQDGELTEVLPVVDELPLVSSTDLQEYFARLMQEKHASASAENEQSDKADKNETSDTTDMTGDFGKDDNTREADDTDQSDEAATTDNTVQSGDADHDGEAEQAEEAEQDETPDNIEVADGDNTTEHTEEEEAQEDKNQAEGTDHE